jgi:hypothetical protein
MVVEAIPIIGVQFDKKALTNGIRSVSQLKRDQSTGAGVCWQ